MQIVRLQAVRNEQQLDHGSFKSPIKATDYLMQPQQSFLANSLDCQRLPIGIVRSYWRDSSEKLVAIKYGTGMALSSRIVLTCSHTLSHESSQLLSFEATFCPHYNNGNINPTQRFVPGLSYHSLHPSSPHHSGTPSQKLSLIELSEPLKECESLNIVQTTADMVGRQITIVGYPSSCCCQKSTNHFDNSKKELKRSRVVSNDEFSLKYEETSETRLCGSAVLAKVQGYSTALIGVHNCKPSFDVTLFNDPICFKIEQVSEALPHQMNQVHIDRHSKTTNPQSPDPKPSKKSKIPLLEDYLRSLKINEGKE